VTFGLADLIPTVMDGGHKFFTGIASNARFDLPAAVVVFFVAVPLCLGIALASGAPLFAGIISGIVGGIVVGSISNSSLGVSGPAAGLTVIVLNAITTLGSFDAFLVSVLLAGILQIILGIARAGIIGYYFPSSVIKGMLAAIGIIIMIKQIPHAIGYDADYEGDLSFLQADGENTFSELIRMLDTITPGAIIVCALALFTMIIWDSSLIKKPGPLKFIHGPLLAVIVGILYQTITLSVFPELSLEGAHLVNVPVAGSAADFFNQFNFPEFGYITNSQVWQFAITIAIVASLETLLSVEATDKLDPQRRDTNTNRELLAQGTGNLVSGLIGGLPITQVILRSSANIQSGAKTKLSTITHGILLLLCVSLIPFILNLVPLAALAAILFTIGFKLAKPATIKQMYNLGWGQFLPYVVTIVGVVFTDLLTGISIGMVVAIIILLRNSYQNSHFLHLENTNGDSHVKMTLAEEVYFLNKGAIAKELNRITPGSFVTIDMSRCIKVDHDVKEVIRDFQMAAASKNIHVKIIPNTFQNQRNGSGNTKEGNSAPLVETKNR
jgi:MFS superfamily sulfate permease-like transporter